MNWLTLLYLACPLMMIFCMAPMFRKGKNNQSNGQGKTNGYGPQSVPSQSPEDIQALQLRIADLMEENHSLKQQIQSAELKEKGAPNILYAVDEPRDKTALS